MQEAEAMLAIAADEARRRNSASNGNAGNLAAASSVSAVAPKDNNNASLGVLKNQLALLQSERQVLLAEIQKLRPLHIYNGELLKQLKESHEQQSRLIQQNAALTEELAIWKEPHHKSSFAMTKLKRQVHTLTEQLEELKQKFKKNGNVEEEGDNNAKDTSTDKSTTAAELHKSASLTNELKRQNRILKEQLNELQERLKNGNVEERNNTKDSSTENTGTAQEESLTQGEPVGANSNNSNKESCTVTKKVYESLRNANNLLQRKVHSQSMDHLAFCHQLSAFLERKVHMGLSCLNSLGLPPEKQQPLRQCFLAMLPEHNQITCQNSNATNTNHSTSGTVNGALANNVGTLNQPNKNAVAPGATGALPNYVTRPYDDAQKGATIVPTEHAAPTNKTVAVLEQELKKAKLSRFQEPRNDTGMLPDPLPIRKPPIVAPPPPPPPAHATGNDTGTPKNALAVSDPWRQLNHQSLVHPRPPAYKAGNFDTQTPLNTVAVANPSQAPHNGDTKSLPVSVPKVLLGTLNITRQQEEQPRSATTSKTLLHQQFPPNGPLLQQQFHDNWKQPTPAPPASNGNQSSRASCTSRVVPWENSNTQQQHRPQQPSAMSTPLPQPQQQQQELPPNGALLQQRFHANLTLRQQLARRSDPNNPAFQQMMRQLLGEQQQLQMQLQMLHQQNSKQDQAHALAHACAVAHLQAQQQQPTANVQQELKTGGVQTQVHQPQSHQDAQENETAPQEPPDQLQESYQRRHEVHEEAKNISQNQSAQVNELRDDSQQPWQAQAPRTNRNDADSGDDTGTICGSTSEKEKKTGREVNKQAASHKNEEEEDEDEMFIDSLDGLLNKKRKNVRKQECLEVGDEEISHDESVVVAADSNQLDIESTEQPRKTASPKDSSSADFDETDIRKKRRIDATLPGSKIVERYQESQQTGTGGGYRMLKKKPGNAESSIQDTSQKQDETVIREERLEAASSDVSDEVERGKSPVSREETGDVPDESDDDSVLSEDSSEDFDYFK